MTPEFGWHPLLAADKADLPAYFTFARPIRETPDRWVDDYPRKLFNDTFATHLHPVFMPRAVIILACPDSYKELGQYLPPDYLVPAPPQLHQFGIDQYNEAETLAEELLDTPIAVMAAVANDTFLREFAYPVTQTQDPSVMIGEAIFFVGRSRILEGGPRNYTGGMGSGKVYGICNLTNGGVEVTTQSPALEPGNTPGHGVPTPEYEEDYFDARSAIEQYARFEAWVAKMQPQNDDGSPYPDDSEPTEMPVPGGGGGEIITSWFIGDDVYLDCAVFAKGFNTSYQDGPEYETMGRYPELPFSGMNIYDDENNLPSIGRVNEFFELR